MATAPCSAYPRNSFKACLEKFIESMLIPLQDMRLSVVNGYAATSMEQIDKGLDRLAEFLG